MAELETLKQQVAKIQDTITRMEQEALKLPEPVYEWQWLLCTTVLSLQFFTESEVEDQTSNPEFLSKIEETKRVRNE